MCRHAIRFLLFAFLFVFLTCCALSSAGFAQRGGSRSSSRSRHSTSHPRKTASGSKHHGRIHRSKAAKDGFMRQQPCPSTGKTSGKCSGYVVDHINPLTCGGVDTPSNMQWQTKAEAKAKDKWERNGCR